MMMTVDRRSYLIAVNRKLVERYFPDAVFCHNGEELYFDLWTSPTPQSPPYQLRLVLPPGSPDVGPELYVWYPVTLHRYGGGTINAEGRTHQFHTWDNGPEGRVQVCLRKDWDASFTYLQTLTTGVLWVTAYEAHLRTGTDICEYFV